jgi:hypothetical protein
MMSSCFLLVLTDLFGLDVTNVLVKFLFIPSSWMIFLDSIIKLSFHLLCKDNYTQVSKKHSAKTVFTNNGRWSLSRTFAMHKAYPFSWLTDVLGQWLRSNSLLEHRFEFGKWIRLTSMRLHSFEEKKNQRAPMRFATEYTEPVIAH